MIKALLNWLIARDHGWRPAVKLRPSRRLVMVRRIDGRKEMREPLPEEEAEYMATDAW